MFKSNLKVFKSCTAPVYQRKCELRKWFLILSEVSVQPVFKNIKIVSIYEFDLENFYWGEGVNIPL